MSLGPVYHVSSLDQAIQVYAEARAQGKPLPVFTTTVKEWPTFAEDIRHSYTVEHECEGVKTRWHGVMLFVADVTKQLT